MPPQRTVRGFGLIDQLKDRKGTTACLLAHVEDADEPIKVEVPDVRNRHQRVMRVLDNLQWTKIDFVNKKGELVYVHARRAEDERPAGELEDLPGAVSGKAAEMSATMGVACHWLLKAQDVALQRHEAATQNATEAQNRMVESTMKRFEAMDRQYNELMRVNHALHGEAIAAQVKALRNAAERVGDAGGDGPLSDAAMEAVLPEIIKALVHRPKDGAKPNGVHKEKAA